MASNSPLLTSTSKVCSCIYILAPRAQPPIDTEAFDEALDMHIRSLADARSQWQQPLAEMRRTRPPQLEAMVSNLLNQGRAVDAAEAEAAEVIPQPPDSPEDGERVPGARFLL